METFDIIVIGAGVGGYPAAIRAAQRGKKVALIEAGEIGGTCLNRGCIPSKALIAGTEFYHRIKKSSSKFGISYDNLQLDWTRLQNHKSEVVKKMRNGLRSLILDNKVKIYEGFASFISPFEIEIKGKDASTLKADKIIIATGSEPRDIPAFPCDHKQILDSTSLLNLPYLPKSIAIIGGGVIGCEFASLLNQQGVEVTICELLPSILPMEAKSVREHLTKSFKSRGIKIETGVQVLGIDKQEASIKVRLADKREIESELALVSIGRSMNTRNIGLEKAGVKVDDKGNIPTNEKMQTNVSHIYAVGDISSKWWLAHVASHQGVVAADNASGFNAIMHYNAVPSVIFTYPEIGTCGLSLEEAKEKGDDAAIGQFPFQALGKAQAILEPEG
ncbi:MAG: dihydrolipoyl dehydrogenase, partial [Parachlamydiaceae bacterium]